MIPPYADINFSDGLEQSSHLWLLFEFHLHAEKPISAKVRPPRLGGNRKIGVFATRSSFRPSNIGLSVVKLENIYVSDGLTKIVVSGVDLVDGTPIIDIKPYLPYADHVIDAHNAMAPTRPGESMAVIFSPQAQATVTSIQHQVPEFEQVLKEVLQQDPRPAYKKQTEDTKVYAVTLYDFDVRWTVTAEVVTINEIIKR